MKPGDVVRRLFANRVTVIIGVFSILLALRWYHPGTVIAQIDCFPILKPWNLFAKSVGAWQFLISPFGSYSFVSYAPLYAAQGIASVVLQPSEVQLASNAVIVFLGVRGAFALMRNFGVGIAPSSFAAWLYVFNPYTMVTLVTFTTGSTLFAAAPWIVNAILRGIADPSERRRQRLVLVIVSSVVVGVIGGTPQVLFGFFIMLGFVTIFGSTVRSRAIGSTRWLIETSSLALIAAAWWLVPQVVSLKTNVVTHDSDPIKISWTFAHAALANDFRLLPIWTWQYPAYFPFAAKYDANVVDYASGFLLFGLAIVALIVDSKRRNATRLFLGSAVFALVFAKGMHEPFVGAYLALLKLPGFFILIEPAGLLVTATLFLAVCASFVFDRANSNPRVAYSISAVALVFGIVSSWALVSGQIFHGQAQWLPSMHARVPGYWKAAATFINERDRRSLVVATPPDSHYEQQYDWGYYGVDLIGQQLITAPVMVLGSALTYLADRRQTAIAYDIQEALDRRNRNLGKLLRGLGVRFVIERGDVRLIGEEAGSPSRLHSMVELVRPVRVDRFGPLALIDLGRSGRLNGSIASDGPYTSGFNARVSTFEPAVRERTSSIPIVASGLARADTMPSFFDAFATTRNTVDITGFNPNPAALSVDLRIALPAKRGTRAYINDGYRSRESAPAERDSIQMMRFEHVDIPEGVHGFVLSFTEATSDAIGQTWSDADHLRLGDSMVVVRSQGHRTAGDYPRSLGEFRVNYRHGDHTKISVKVPTSAALEGFFVSPILMHAARAIPCFVPLDSSAFALESVLSRCRIGSDRNGGAVRVELVSATRQAGRGRAVVSIARNLPFESGAFTDVATIPKMGSTQSRSFLGGRIFDVTTHAPGFLLTGELYDPRFVAIDLKHPISPLRPRQLFGWMGALPVPSGDSGFFVFNLINLIEGIAYVISCFIVMLLSGSAIYSRFSHTSAAESRSPVSSSVTP